MLLGRDDMDCATVRQGLETALFQMEEALSLLDACNAPADIGAHLDTALCRLRDHLQVLPAEDPGQELRRGQH